MDRGGAEDLLQGQHTQQNILDTDPDGLPCPAKLCIYMSLCLEDQTWLDPLDLPLANVMVASVR